MIKMVNNRVSFKDTKDTWRFIYRSKGSDSNFRSGHKDLSLPSFIQSKTPVLAPKEISYWEVSND